MERGIECATRFPVFQYSIVPSPQPQPPALNAQLSTFNSRQNEREFCHHRRAAFPGTSRCFRAVAHKTREFVCAFNWDPYDDTRTHHQARLGLRSPDADNAIDKTTVFAHRKTRNKSSIKQSSIRPAGPQPSTLNSQPSLQSLPASRLVKSWKFSEPVQPRLPIFAIGPVRPRLRPPRRRTAGPSYNYRTNTETPKLGSRLGGNTMEIKMYVPKVAEIPSEYLAPLAQRARDSLGDAASTTPATRGHLVRQAIKDGLLRGMDNLIRDFGAVVAVCAFALPSMASAASWGVVGSTHSLASSNLGLTAHSALGQLTSSCAMSTFHSNVGSASALVVTAVALSNCTSGGAAGDCTVTSTGTRFPWTVTGTTLTNIQIHGVHLDLRFETKPGSLPGSCIFHNIDVTLTGTLTGGVWDAAAHQVTFSAAPGLALHSVLGTSIVTVSGTIRDTAQTLTLT